MINYKIVKKEDIKTLAKLASTIWHEYWVKILSIEQIDYMVQKFQSESAILNQCENERYTYYFITENGENIGYFGILGKKDYLFLSKLYILKDFRRKGVGAKAFEKIKEIAKEKNYKSIQLNVNKQNTNTINAYTKWGFKPIDSVIIEIGNGFTMDDYVMEYSF